MVLKATPIRNIFAHASWFAVVTKTLAIAAVWAASGDLHARSPDTVYFRTDVIPVLTKAGCNSGGCHGKATGQGGFKLSLLGFEPDADYRALVLESRGRRLFPAAPDKSLLLRKATANVAHGGGRRLERGSEEYAVLRRWIAAGAPEPRIDAPGIERLVVTPSRGVLANDAQQRLQVRALLSNGEVRDVTRQAVYESNAPELAEVSEDGLVATHRKPGLFSVMVRFGGKLDTYHAAIPVAAGAAERNLIEEQLSNLQRRLDSPWDALLISQWRELGITPSGIVDDATFIRRASLDICGTLPTRAEVEAYLSDQRPEKRKRLIDALLERPEYASYFALKWGDILQNRGSGYSTRRQRAGTALLASWIRDSIAANKPYDEFVREIITASGRQYENPPAIWYRQVRTQQDYVESVAQAFLGVRVQCAQCHHHPFERWSQADYYGLAAVFARVGRKGGFADAEVPTNEIIYLKDAGEVRHPRSGRIIEPKALGGPVFRVTAYDDPRGSLADWMVAPENPFFARTMVNRMWAHFHGRGIIHPIDDARSTNPPSNPELLDALAQDFASHGYDLKHLIRTICNMLSYRLQSEPNQHNRFDTQTFARFYPRRLSAEVLLDAVSQVLEVPTTFSGGDGQFPVGTRAIDLPDENVPSSFLDVFGRPPRSSACECERSDSPGLAQALTLINSPEIHKKLTDKNGYAARLAGNEKPVEENVRDIFMSLLNRPPASSETDAAVEFLKGEADRAEAYRSLLWSLLATNEFLFNH